MGWNWVRQISRQHEVWVITRAANRKAIEGALREEPLPNAHWVYFDLPRWARFWKKGVRGVHAYYYLWQASAYFTARKLHRRIGFDLAHHVTFVNYWMPSFLALLPVPFVWGPVGGGESSPSSFWASFSLRGKIHELARDLARTLARFDPFVRLTARRSALALATTEDTASRLRALGCKRIAILPESGLTQDEIRRLGSFPVRHGNPFRVVSIGNLLHLKGFHLALRAFAQFHSMFSASEYWLIGDGPERRRLEKLARKLGLAWKVTFWGSQPRSLVMEKLAACDTLLHPSLHDSGGWICLEAMAAGRPVICLDLGGPAVQVTEKTGIKVSPFPPEQIVSQLASALYQLASDPILRAELARSARDRVAANFAWDRKALLLMEIYSKTVNAAQDRRAC